MITGKYPSLRLRRSRKYAWSRRLVQENSLSYSDLILPIFLIEGKNRKESIKSMPNVYRYSVDKLQSVVTKAIKKGIPMVALFPHTKTKKKDDETSFVDKTINKSSNIDIGLSIGFGLDDTQYLNSKNTKVGGNNEFYIALDYDLKRVLKRWDTPTAKRIKHWLNYIKIPAPAILFSPEAKFYPIFF